MANIDLGWEVDGIMTPQESVSAMIKVIESKGIQHSGTFWTWENKVCDPDDVSGRSLTLAAISLVAAWLVVLSARPPASKVLQGPGLSDQGMRRTKNLAKAMRISDRSPTHWSPNSTCNVECLT